MSTLTQPGLDHNDIGEICCIVFVFRCRWQTLQNNWFHRGTFTSCQKRRCLPTVAILTRVSRSFAIFKKCKNEVCHARSAPGRARHSLRGGCRGNFCVGARIVAMATAWAHSVSVQVANTTKKKSEESFCVRPQTDFIRLVSSELMLWGASRRPGPPF